MPRPIIENISDWPLFAIEQLGDAPIEARGNQVYAIIGWVTEEYVPIFINNRGV